MEKVDYPVDFFCDLSKPFVLQLVDNIDQLNNYEEITIYYNRFVCHGINDCHEL